MENQKHTPEPWDDFAFEIYDSEKNIIADCGYSDDVWGKAQCKANAARIVACVNAMQGIENPEAFMCHVKASLDSGARQALTDVAVQELKDQRDELLAALKFCRSVLEKNGIFDVSDRMAVDKATAAIDKAKGDSNG